MSDEQQAAHLAAINRLNRMHRDLHLGQPELDGRIEAFEMSFDLQTTAPQIFDLSKESRSTLDLYGNNQFSRHCLTARRLVENGVRFVEILDGATGRKWDAHGNRGGLFDNHRANAARRRWLSGQPNSVALPSRRRTRKKRPVAVITIKDSPSGWLAAA